MSFKAGATLGTPAQFQTWFLNCFSGEPGWTVLHDKVTDSNGYLVSVVQNTINNYVLVAFFDMANTTGSCSSAIVLAESYTLAGSTVLNPATTGTFGPNLGDVAYTSQVSLASLTTADFAGAKVPISVNTGAKTAGAMVTRDAFALGVDQKTGSTSSAWNGWHALLGAVTPASPSIEPNAPVLISRSTGTSGIATSIINSGGRVNRTPLSSTWPTATAWGILLGPWQPFAAYGTDAYSIEPGAIPTTEAVVRRAGAADGRGLLRGTFKSFRFGTGTTGQQITDGAGDVWEYRPGGTLTSNSSTISTDISPFSGWWKVS